MFKSILSASVFILLFTIPVCAQEYFTISKYNVAIKVNKDASLDIEETIKVHFTESRHGIMRFVPYRYKLQSIPDSIEKTAQQLVSGNTIYTIIENIDVKDWKYTVQTEGDYKVIKIGDADKYVTGDQTYTIQYRILNAINFFTDNSELYFNVIGDKWNTTIDSVQFTVTLYDALPQLPAYFIATGPTGSTDNNSIIRWQNNKIFSGYTFKKLENNEGVTIGIRFPKGFLEQQNYRLRGIYWMLLPLIVLLLLYKAWHRWGKDEEVTIKTEYYPPQNISPSVSGYIIDDRLHRRDLTALVPYWGASGYLQVNEIENTSLFGLIKNKEYQFIKLKELPPEAMTFEKTLFNGIFKSGNAVMLNDLKNVLYTSMATAKKELEEEVDKNEYYVRGSRTMGWLFIAASFFIGIYGTIRLMNEYYVSPWLGLAIILSAVLLLFFGFFMSKRTKKGTLLYQQLA
ncbi:MAG TPA: DUF2207 domain-containing protein, partial [Chitinophagaceae bacterium]|nr:DUF2207 domain-containing protein [Chitinophagaceae bacterium]